ncbi:MULTISPECIES: RluA family pseudouridine synthase [unclassified Schlesneria]|uniref:RluA family pseudouridine synthase n=1 Tax=Schlesneria TaxID=656899 RepID=UPI002F096E7E
MHSATLVVESYLSGCRVDTFLVKHFRSYTAWRMHRMVRAGQVTVEGVVAAPERRVFTNEVVTVRLLEPPDNLMPAEEISFGVVFEDQWLLIVNKPAGLIVHPTGQNPSGTLTNAVQHYLDQNAQFPGQFKPGVVHRLDRDTSGVVALAKDHLSHRLLSMQFQRERISKSYLALVDGVLKEDSGTIDLPIGRARSGASALMSCQADAIDAKASKTSFEVIERFSRHTLVKAKPRTGRLHQIRVHLSTIGHPVVGDDFYGPFGELKPDRVRPVAGGPELAPMSPYIPRQALHAAELSFAHPMTSEWHTFTAPLPPDFEQALDLVRAI